MLRYTTILHEPRKKLNELANKTIKASFTVMDYMIIDSIYHLSKDGWCTASKQYLADWLGCNKRTVIRAINKGIELGLLKRPEKAKNADNRLKTTQKWFELVYFSGSSEDKKYSDKMSLSVDSFDNFESSEADFNPFEVDNSDKMSLFKARNGDKMSLHNGKMSHNNNTYNNKVNNNIGISSGFNNPQELFNGDRLSKPVNKSKQKKVLNEKYLYLTLNPYGLKYQDVFTLIEIEKESKNTIESVAEWWRKEYYEKGKEGNPFALMYSALKNNYDLYDYSEWGKMQAF